MEKCELKPNRCELGRAFCYVRFLILQKGDIHVILGIQRNEDEVQVKVPRLGDKRIVDHERDGLDCVLGNDRRRRRCW